MEKKSPKRNVLSQLVDLIWFDLDFWFTDFSSQAGRAPLFLPFQPWYTTENRPQHRELRALLLATSVWVLLRPTGL